MRKFKVGDRVENINRESYTFGFSGVVKKYEEDWGVDVKWDGFTGKGGSGVGFWSVDPDSLKLIGNTNLKSKIGRALKHRGFSKTYRNKVMPFLNDAYFYQNDRLCFLKTREGVGYAMRNPVDEHDEELAICLCVKRIFGEEKKEFKIGAKVKFLGLSGYTYTDFLFPNGIEKHLGEIKDIMGDSIYVRIIGSKYKDTVLANAHELKLV